ncbi:unnamed protein product [Lampetra planeri]
MNAATAGNIHSTLLEGDWHIAPRVPCNAPSRDAGMAPTPGVELCAEGGGAVASGKPPTSTCRHRTEREKVQRAHIHAERGPSGGVAARSVRADPVSVILHRKNVA